MRIVVGLDSLRAESGTGSTGQPSGAAGGETTAEPGLKPAQALPVLTSLTPNYAWATRLTAAALDEAFVHSTLRTRHRKSEGGAAALHRLTTL